TSRTRRRRASTGFRGRASRRCWAGSAGPRATWPSGPATSRRASAPRRAPRRGTAGRRRPGRRCEGSASFLRLEPFILLQVGVEDDVGAEYVAGLPDVALDASVVVAPGVGQGTRVVVGNPAAVDLPAQGDGATMGHHDRQAALDDERP